MGYAVLLCQELVQQHGITHLIILRYNIPAMMEIRPLRPEQAAEARRLIHTVAQAQFNPELTLEEAFARYDSVWPIPDVLDFQRAYVDCGGVFLAMFDGQKMIGTGALKPLDDGAAEIKRLWFLPEYQNRGLGYRMMMALIDTARQRGYAKLVLETSPQYQPRAFAFYQKLGFYEIPRYGDDPDDVGMEMQLE